MPTSGELQLASVQTYPPPVVACEVVPRCGLHQDHQIGGWSGLLNSLVGSSPVRLITPDGVAAPRMCGMGRLAS